MSDYRTRFIEDTEIALSQYYDLKIVNQISTIITTVLNDYELTKRCTEIAVYDDTNTKIIKLWKGCLILNGKSAGTIYQYTRAVRLLIETVVKPLTEMTVYDLRYYIASLKTSGISNVSLENTRTYLHTFFQWMVLEEMIQKNPMSAIKPISCPKEIKKPFSDIEIDAIRGSCETLKERALIEILLSTGVRVSELSHMDITDINFQNLTVFIKHGKGNKERITYTTPVSVKYLSKYISERKEVGTGLFYNKNHKPLQAGGIRCILKTLEKKSGVTNIHPHRFRHTFATNLANRGMGIEEIQKLLGHTNLDTTLTYVYTSDAKVASSYRKYTV